MKTLVKNQRQAVAILMHYLMKSLSFVLSTGNTSTSYVQRKFSVGFNRAARIMDQLEEQGILGPMKNGKREILARRSEY